jgi:hypothetical protein
MKNIGNVDTTVRAIGGFAALSVGILHTSWWGLGGLAVVLTSVVRWCPVYAVFGFSTKRVRAASEVTPKG